MWFQPVYKVPCDIYGIGSTTLNEFVEQRSWLLHTCGHGFYTHLASFRCEHAMYTAPRYRGMSLCPPESPFLFTVSTQLPFWPLSPVSFVIKINNRIKKQAFFLGYLVLKIMFLQFISASMNIGSFCWLLSIVPLNRCLLICWMIFLKLGICFFSHSDSMNNHGSAILVKVCLLMNIHSLCSWVHV